MQIDLENLDDEFRQLHALRDFETLLEGIRQMFQRMVMDKRLFGIALYEPVSDRWMEKIARSFHRRKSPPYDDTVLHVASEVYTTGGHTRVFEDIVAALPEKRHILILTAYHESARLPSLLEDRFSKLAVEVVFLQEKDILGRIEELLDYVEHFSPHTIFINAHHQDVIAYGAICGETAPRVVFLHHADYLPSLGATRTDYEHIDLTSECHRFCCQRPELSPSLLRMTVADQGVAVAPVTPALIGATCGTHFKFNGRIQFTYIELVAALFNSGVEKLHHIGNMPTHQQTALQNELAALGADPDRLVFVGNVPSLATYLKELAPHFYLESFPLGGGKARIEAMSLGIPILRPEPEGRLPLFHWQDSIGPATLFETLEKIPQVLNDLLANRAQQSSKARQFYLENHSPALFRSHLLELTGPAPEKPAPSSAADDIRLMSFHDICRLDRDQDVAAGNGHSASALKPGVISPNGVAISGHDGYLFIGNGSNKWEEQFLGRLITGEVWSEQWYKILAARQEAARQAGVELWNLVVPEKQSILAEKRWPDLSSAGVARPMLALLDKLPANQCLIYPDRTMATAAKRYPVYFRHNSHWTVSGCLTVLKLLLRAFSIDININSIRFRAKINRHAHDLTVHFFDPAPEEEAISLLPCGEVVEDNRMYERTKQHTGSFYRIDNPEAYDTRHIMIFGDSYAYDAGLASALSAIFQSVSFIWSKDVLWDHVTAAGPDIILWESAERYMLTHPQS